MRCVIKEVLSEGCVIGKIVKQFNKNVNTLKGDMTNERAKFNNALMTSLLQINDLSKKNPELAEYLAVHELIAVDPELLKKVNGKINDGLSAKESVEMVFADYIHELGQSSSRYLYERILDIQDVGQRIINNLENISNDKTLANGIFVFDVVYPSFIIQHHNEIAGIIAKSGGYSSHAAILCRSWDIPFVLMDGDFDDGDTAIIDTRKRLVIKNPNESDESKYLKELSFNDNIDSVAIPHDSYLFLANISDNKEIDKANKYGFDGIGLYRTEFIFMNSKRPYSLEEQARIYTEAVRKNGNKRFVFRTFDIAQDKDIAYLNNHNSTLENYIDNKEIFENQIKAILAANAYGKVRIMFPMIKTSSEFHYLKEWVLRIIKENNYNPSIRIGMMLETKSAINNIADFKDADFISIGTNDLTKELYHVDRDSSTDNIEQYLSDLLIKLKNVVKFCKDNLISLSVCGELASIPEAAISFYEIGIKNLSVNPTAIKMLNAAYLSFAKGDKK